MRSRVLQRRAATAGGIYGSAVLGILATVVAAREMSTDEFPRFALVFAITGLLQMFLDLTANEVVVKYGNRYAAQGDWGRFRRLFDIGLRIKLAGGVLSAAAVIVAAVVASWIWNRSGLRAPLLIAACVPLLQAPEGMAEAVLLVRNRYDVRGGLLLWSMALRLAAVAAAGSFGVTAAFAAIVVAQLVATGTALGVGLVVFRRWPRAAPVALGDDAPAIRNFAVQSTVASGLSSLQDAAADRARRRRRGSRSRSGASGSPRRRRRRSRRSPRRRGSSCSPSRRATSSTDAPTVPVRLLRRYIEATIVLAGVAVPVLWIAMPTLVRVDLRQAVRERGDAGAPDPARRCDPARLRLDEVVSGLDREARPAHRRAGGRDRDPDPARARARRALRRLRRGGSTRRVLGRPRRSSGSLGLIRLSGRPFAAAPDGAVAP